MPPTIPPAPLSPEDNANEERQERLAFWLQQIDDCHDNNGGQIDPDEEQAWVERFEDLDGEDSQECRTWFARATRPPQERFGNWGLAHLAIARDSLDLARVVLAQGVPDTPLENRPFHAVRSVQACELLAAAGHDWRQQPGETWSVLESVLISRHAEPVDLPALLEWFEQRGEVLNLKRLQNLAGAQVFEDLLQEIPALSVRLKAQALRTTLPAARPSPRTRL